MPQPCPEHKEQAQISCETCFPDSELQLGIERMQAVKFPSARPESRKKQKRLDDPSAAPKKRKSWKDDLFG